MVFDRKWFIILICLLVEVCSRPQLNDNAAPPSVEFSIIPIGLRFPNWLPHPNIHQVGFYPFSPHPFQQQNIYPYAYRLVPDDTKTSKDSVITNKSTYNIKEIVPISDREDKRLANIRETSSSKDEIEENSLTPESKNSQLNIQKPPSLAPYRFHPLLNYIKNGNTIRPDKILRFRNTDSTNQDVTTLILKPVARSIAGVDGKAMATPVSKAILRKGTSVDILFEPDAIAIAGPGGIAHAESDLEISYEDEDE